MHELSITKELIRITLEESKCPHTIKVKLGRLTSYRKDPIIFYFDQLKNDHEVLKNSTLDIEEIDGQIKCNHCKKESIVNDPTMIFCPLCESSDITFIKGQDIVVESIENV